MSRLGTLLRAFRPRQVDREAAGRVKAWAAAALGPGDITLTVNEIVCGDPSCPGLETVILIMEPGRKTRAIKLAKALDELTEQEVRDALV